MLERSGGSEKPASKTITATSFGVEPISRGVIHQDPKNNHNAMTLGCRSPTVLVVTHIFQRSRTPASSK